MKDSIDSLQAFWPSLQVLIGDIGGAVSLHQNYFAVWQKFGFLPEMFRPQSLQLLPFNSGYPLRPELIESTLYLYLATNESHFIDVGEIIMDSIQNFSRVPCGYAAIRDVETKSKEDRLDSFFLSETLKYLYLLFDRDNQFNGVDWVFTTEGHPFSIKFIDSFSRRQNVHETNNRKISRQTQLQCSFFNLTEVYAEQQLKNVNKQKEEPVCSSDTSNNVGIPQIKVDIPNLNGMATDFLLIIILPTLFFVSIPTTHCFETKVWVLSIGYSSCFWAHLESNWDLW